jgi:hypothetical protein
MLRAPFQTQRILIVGALAQLAFVASIALERWGNSRWDFWAGFFAGFALAGNVLLLYAAAQSKRE